MGPDQHAGGQISEQRRNPQAPEQGDRHDRRAQKDQDFEEKSGFGHSNESAGIPLNGVFAGSTFPPNLENLLALASMP
jgi:hypothetical protein